MKRLGALLLEESEVFLRAIEQIDYQVSFLVDPDGTISNVEELEIEKIRIWKWADRTFHGAWSKACERLYGVLDSSDERLKEMELEVYLSECKRLIALYKFEKARPEREQFFHRVDRKLQDEPMQQMEFRRKKP